MQLREARALASRLAADALCVLSGAGIGTPELGYLHEPVTFRADLETLARQRDEALFENVRLRAELAACREALHDLKALVHSDEVTGALVLAALHGYQGTPEQHVVAQGVWAKVAAALGKPDA